MDELNLMNTTMPKSGKDIQAKWDEINIKIIISSLKFPSDAHIARKESNIRYRHFDR